MSPKGHYLAHEIALLAGVSPAMIGQWSRRGLMQASQSKGPPKVYSYQDAAEAIVVHELVERNFPHREILKAIATLRDEYPLNWPLSHRPDLGVIPEGTRERYRATLVVGDQKQAYDIGRQAWNLVVNPESLRYVRDLLQRGGWAARSLPDLQFVEVDPNRLSGRPAIRGRRVPAIEVAETAAEPGGVADLVEGFDLTEKEIHDAVRWWDVARHYQAA